MFASQDNISDLQLIDLFLTSISLDKSQNTYFAYKNDLELLHKFLLLQKQSFTSCTQVEISEYFAEYFIRDKYGFVKIIEAVSVRRKISVFRAFFGFLYEEKYISNKPIDNVEIPKKAQKLPFYLTEEEVASIFAYTSGQNTKDGIRMNAILHILYSCGLRVSEAITMKISDVFDGQNIRKKTIILGKGNKERTVFLDKNAQKAIEKYIAIRDYFKPNSGNKFLFCANNSGGYLTRQSVFVSLQKIAYKVGTSEKTSPHKLRHSFATHMYQSGIDLRMLQVLLGHSDISTTEIYTHIKADDIKTTLEKFHPIFNKKA